MSCLTSSYTTITTLAMLSLICFRSVGAVGFECNITSMPHQGLCIVSMTEKEFKKKVMVQVCVYFTHPSNYCINCSFNLSEEAEDWLLKQHK